MIMIDNYIFTRPDPILPQPVDFGEGWVIKQRFEYVTNNLPYRLPTLDNYSTRIQAEHIANGSNIPYETSIKVSKYESVEIAEKAFIQDENILENTIRNSLVSKPSTASKKQTEWCSMRDHHICNNLGQYNEYVVKFWISTPRTNLQSTKELLVDT